MANGNVYMIPDNAGNTLDPNLMMALSQNGGFGNNGNWMWMMFMWILFPWLFNGNNNFGGNNGTGFLANQLNNDAGRDLLLQAINGRADALTQLAGMLNTDVNSVRDGVNTINVALANMNGTIGLTGQQIISQILQGDASLSRQLCECCCENRLAIANQTAALQSGLAAHDASVRLQLAQNEAADQLSVCQQTNTLTRQADGNTNSILGAIQAQNTLITKEFCDLKERELQNKIDTQGDIITQLRNQISNDKQTLQFNAAFHALDIKAFLGNQLLFHGVHSTDKQNIGIRMPLLISLRHSNGRIDMTACATTGKYHIHKETS